MRIVRHHSARSLIRAIALVMAGFLIAESAAAQVPAAPSNVRLSIVRDNAIDVFWQDNSGNEAAFDVFRKVGGGGYSLLGAVDANITFFQDRNSGIRPNLEFCYRVAARNASGSSPQSNEACVTVPPRPNAPSDLQVSRDGPSTAVSLNWVDNSSNETDFLIYRDTDGLAFVLYDTVDANVTSYSDTVLRTQGTYCYFVSAINNAGESPGTDPDCVDVTLGAPVPPVSMVAETVSDDAIRTIWVFGLINHSLLVLERSDDGQQTWTDVFQTGSIVSSHTDSGLDPNTEYCYRLRLENPSGIPSFSPISCSSTSFSVPDTPEDLLTEGLENLSIEITWSPVTSASIRYRLERQTGGNPFQLVVDSLETPAHVETELSASAVHCYRVRAFNPEFFSEWSAVSCGIVAPDGVEALTASPAAGDPLSQLTVGWSPGAGVAATSFLVSYRPAGQGEFSEPVAVTSNQTTISGLDDATAYEVAVQARRVLGESVAHSGTEATSATTFLSFWPGDANGDGSVNAQDVAAFTAPACFGQSTAFTTDGGNVAWTELAVDLAGQDPAVLRCDTDRTGLVDIFDFLAIAANAGRTTGKGSPVKSAIVDAAHLARVESIYDSFNPAPGDVAQERLKDELRSLLQAKSEEHPTALALGSIYPNPVAGRFSATLDLPETSYVEGRIVNSAGQVVDRPFDGTLSAGRRVIELDVTDLPPGVYFLVIEAGGAGISRPIVVTR